MGLICFPFPGSHEICSQASAFPSSGHHLSSSDIYLHTQAFPRSIFAEAGRRRSHFPGWASEIHPLGPGVTQLGARVRDWSGFL